MFNIEALSIELNKWTKPMLIEFILKKATPSSIKISDDLQSMIDAISTTADAQHTSCSMETANILKSVVSAFDSISASDLKLHDKLDQWFLTGALPPPWEHFGLYGVDSFEGGVERAVSFFKLRYLK